MKNKTVPDRSEFLSNELHPTRFFPNFPTCRRILQIDKSQSFGLFSISPVAGHRMEEAVHARQVSTHGYTSARPSLGERSGSGFWKGQREEGLVREVWGQKLYILNKPKLRKLHVQPGLETLQTQWKAGDRTSGRTGSLPGQTDTAPEGAPHLCVD